MSASPSIALDSSSVPGVAYFNETGAIAGDPAQVSGTQKAKHDDIIQLYATGLGSSAAGPVIATPIVFQGTITITVNDRNRNRAGSGRSANLPG